LRTAVRPLYQVPFAEEIKKTVGIPTGAVGLITTAKEAESIIVDGKADLVLLVGTSFPSALCSLIIDPSLLCCTIVNLNELGTSCVT
jgi:ABC-type microcin C transport system permease subunit YejB